MEQSPFASDLMEANYCELYYWQSKKKGANKWSNDWIRCRSCQRFICFDDVKLMRHSRGRKPNSLSFQYHQAGFLMREALLFSRVMLSTSMMANSCFVSVLNGEINW